ncbi:hypothetical protein HPB50_009952 [Hyalomma asiaticum]|uniref:Uncharacterized protein n=1 Tax=Hyalomma asiaticum TaxID=266040 RepID=A0ACB7TI28_HYAAI|nr:hypothetical protein HPB50_009952 [Hyalomma asiaticum]
MSSAPQAITNDVLVCNNGKANSPGCPAPMFAATAQVSGRQLQKRYVLRPGARCRVNTSVCRRTAGLCDAVMQFNDRNRHVLDILKQACIEPGHYTMTVRLTSDCRLCEEGRM